MSGNAPLNPELLIQEHPHDEPLSRETLALLEWPSLQRLLINACITVEGGQAWQQPRFYTSRSTVQRLLLEAEALLGVLQRHGLPDLELPCPSITALLPRLSAAAPLSLAEGASLLRFLLLARKWINAVRRQTDWDALAHHHLPVDEAPLGWLHTLQDVTPAIETLQSVLTADGHMLDSASPTLAELRQRERAQHRALMQQLEQLLRQEGFASCLQDRLYTQRNGRYVFPVLSTHKASFPGVIHDVSASGQTVYMEPLVIVTLHNRLTETQQAVVAEMQRILQQLAQALAPLVPTLQAWQKATVRLDERWAAAELARKLRAVRPLLLKEEQPATVQLLEARHPLLALQPEAAVVPNTLDLQNQGGGSAQAVRTVIISGPNTGGKTVVLKTAGLLAVMVRAGLLLPVQQGSALSLFHPIVADIGDAQDLQQNLSTFSGHIRRLAGLLQQDGQLTRALVLIDEIAAGTDPVEGAALAREVLRNLTDQGALTLVTTHLSVLKTEAHHQPGYLNASVLFDVTTLSPTYQLALGVPGTSHALVIAQRYGMPSQVIEAARQRLGQGERSSADLLSTLEARQVAVEAVQKELEQARQEVVRQRDALKAELQHLREQKKRLVLEYRSGLKQRLREVEDQLKQLRKKVQQYHLQNEETPIPVKLQLGRLRHVQGQAFGTLDQALQQLASEEAAAEAAKVNDIDNTAPAPLQPGDRVTLVASGQSGEVEQLSADGKKAQVLVNGLRVTLAVTGLERREAGLSAQAAQALRKAERRQLVQRLQQMETGRSVAAALAKTTKSQHPLQCDLRGMRVGEALQELERFLDGALVAGYDTVGIVHGLGTGALKNAVRDYLATMPQVKRFYPEQAIHGGDGKTLVELGGD